jgi:hypothetical protein
MVNTVDKLKLKTYNLQIKGSVVGTYKTYNSDTVNIDVNVFDRCLSSVFITTSISDLYYDI